MAEEAIIKRINTAKGAAIQFLKDTKHKIIPSDNSEFCFLAIRKKEIRMIRIVIDEITEDDIKIISDFESPGVCTKEIWCRRKGDRKFEIKEID